MGLAVSLALLCVLSACSTRCTPDEPCVAGTEGPVRAPCVAAGTCKTLPAEELAQLVFDCGASQCHGAQICVVPGSCDDDADYSSGEARCVERPSACTDLTQLCECTMGQPVAGESGSGNLSCCYVAGWQPGRDHICNYACL